LKEKANPEVQTGVTTIPLVFPKTITIYRALYYDANMQTLEAL